MTGFYFVAGGLAFFIVLQSIFVWLFSASHKKQKKDLEKIVKSVPREILDAPLLKPPLLKHDDSTPMGVPEPRVRYYPPAHDPKVWEVPPQMAEEITKRATPLKLIVKNHLERKVFLDLQEAGPSQTLESILGVDLQSFKGIGPARSHEMCKLVSGWVKNSCGSYKLSEIEFLSE